eukprot:CAMPEP_0177786476 /NCGR_PEP_ID=MMETSP0491_2-20121128/20947_1 /TAXON_ID=63592 /ORGANISM="Tetraselmis chuii, Strain PLY429" /LENGTH=272 /DNA_ID=CAMNT_0019307697 /DNA_START=463 /DNA_END=1280 /DNA_ORIENTATION=-
MAALSLALFSIPVLLLRAVWAQVSPQLALQLGAPATAALTLTLWILRGIKIVAQGNQSLLESGWASTAAACRLVSTSSSLSWKPYLIHAQSASKFWTCHHKGASTTDNAPISADAVVYFRIVDSALSRYGVDNLLSAVQNLVLTQLRTEVGRLSLDQTFSARAELNQKLLIELDQATSYWGVKITRVEVRDILPEASIKAALEKQMTAERTKRADILESEGVRMAEVNKATGLADAQILQAEVGALSCPPRSSVSRNHTKVLRACAVVSNSA